MDTNQPEIVNALRKAGCSVQHLHMVGHGCPDILVGFHDKNILMEIKDGSLSFSKRCLTPDELEWFENWRGSAHIVNNIDQALLAAGVIHV